MSLSLSLPLSLCVVAPPRLLPFLEVRVLRFGIEGFEVQRFFGVYVGSQTQNPKTLNLKRLRR